MALAELVCVPDTSWVDERAALLDRRISDMGITIERSRVASLVAELHRELAARGVPLSPAVYLTDEWGCPDGTPLIGVPFYLADPRLERIEAEMSGAVEDDREAMRYLRHEAGHAVNYAFALHERPDWQRVFGLFQRPYRERYPADPFSRSFVRHILGWYAQKHPDEDFAETFAVWLTPDEDWRAAYAGWPAMEKLEYVDGVMGELSARGERPPAVPAAPAADDLPVEAMRYTVRQYYERAHQSMPIGDARQFDIDLRRIFVSAEDAPGGESAGAFVERHAGEIVSRLAYWTSEPPSVVRSLVNHIVLRAGDLNLRVGSLEASTLIELTAFGTAVAMHHRAGRTPARARRARPTSVRA